jgi:hypothetical protein
MAILAIDSKRRKKKGEIQTDVAPLTNWWRRCAGGLKRKLLQQQA